MPAPDIGGIVLRDFFKDPVGPLRLLWHAGSSNARRYIAVDRNHAEVRPAKSSAPAEIRLLQRLVDGENLRDAAGQLHISFNTARTH